MTKIYQKQLTFFNTYDIMILTDYYKVTDDRFNDQVRIQ